MRRAIQKFRKAFVGRMTVLAIAFPILSGCGAADSLTTSVTAPDKSVTQDNTVLPGGFPGCISGNSFDKNAITIEFEFPPNATAMYINRDGERRHTLLPTGVTTWIDANLTEGQTYHYTCEAVIEGRVYVGFTELFVATKVQNAPDFGGVTQAVDVSDADARKIKVTWKPANTLHNVIPDNYKVYVTLEKGTDPGKEEPDWTSTPREVIVASSAVNSVTISDLGDDLPYAIGVRACTLDPSSGAEVCDQNHAHANVKIGDWGMRSNEGLTEAVAGNGGVQLTMPWNETYGAVKERVIYYKLRDGTFLDSQLPPNNPTLTGYQTYTVSVAKYSSNYTDPPRSITITSGLLDQSTYIFVVRDRDEHGQLSQNTSYREVALNDITAPQFSGIQNLTWAAATEPEPKKPENTAIVSWLAVTAEDDGDPMGADQYYIYITSADPTYTPTDACTLIGTATQPAHKVAAAGNAAGATISYPLPNLISRRNYSVCVTAVDKKLNPTRDAIVAWPITMRDVSAPAFGGINEASFSGGKLSVGWVPATSADVRNYRITVKRYVQSNAYASVQSVQRFWINSPAASIDLYKTPPVGLEDRRLTLTDYDRLDVTVDACDNAFDQYTVPTQTADNCTRFADEGTPIPVTVGDSTPPVSQDGGKINSKYATPSTVDLWWNIQDIGSTPADISSKLYYTFTDYPGTPVDPTFQSDPLEITKTPLPPDWATFELKGFTAPLNQDYNYLFLADVWDASSNHMSVRSDVIRVDRKRPPPAINLGWTEGAATTLPQIHPSWLPQCDGPCEGADTAALKHYITVYQYAKNANTGGTQCPVPKPTSPTDPNVKQLPDYDGVDVKDTPLTIASIENGAAKYRYEIKTVDHAGNFAVACSNEISVNTVVTRITKIYTDTPSNPAPAAPYPNGTEINIKVLFSKPVGLFTATLPTITLKTGGTDLTPKTRQIPADIPATLLNNAGYFDSVNRILSFKYVVGPEDFTDSVKILGTDLDQSVKDLDGGNLAKQSADSYFPVKGIVDATENTAKLVVDGILPKVDYVTTDPAYKGSLYYGPGRIPIWVVFTKSIASVSAPSILIDVNREKTLSVPVSCDTTVSTFDDFTGRHSYIVCNYDIRPPSTVPGMEWIGDYGVPLNYHDKNSFTGTVVDQPAGNQAVNPPMPDADPQSPEYLLSLAGAGVNVDTTPPVITFAEGEGNTTSPVSKMKWHWKVSKQGFLSAKTVITKGAPAVASDFPAQFTRFDCTPQDACPDGFPSRFHFTPPTFDSNQADTLTPGSTNPKLEGVYYFNVRVTNGSTVSAIHSVPVLLDNVPPSAQAALTLTYPELAISKEKLPVFKLTVESSFEPGDRISLHPSAEKCVTGEEPLSDPASVATTPGSSSQTVSALEMPEPVAPAINTPIFYHSRVTDLAGNYNCGKSFLYTYDAHAGIASTLSLGGTLPPQNPLQTAFVVSAGDLIQGIKITAFDHISQIAKAFTGEKGVITMTVASGPTDGKILDSNGTEIAGQQITVYATLGVADLSPFKITKAGTYVLSLSATGTAVDNLKKDVTFEVKARTTPDPVLSSVVASPTTIYQGQKSTITVTLKDLYGNPIPSSAINLTFDQVSGGVFRGTPTPTSATSGIYKVDWIGKVAGTSTISGYVSSTEGGASNPLTQTPEITVNTNTVTFDAATSTSAIVEGSQTNGVSNPAIINVKIEHTPDADISVPFTLSGTGTAGVDYTAPSSPVLIPAQANGASITFAITNDAVYRPNRTVIATIGTPDLASAGMPAPTHTVTITEDDPVPKPRFWLGVQSVTEGTGAVATVTVSLAGATYQDVIVPFEVDAASTAAEGVHYAALAESQFTIAAGTTSASIPITLLNDDIYRGSNTLILTLKTPSGGGVTELAAPTSHTVTINDDEGIPKISFAAASQSVSEGGNKKVTVNLSAKSSKNIVVNFGLTGSDTRLSLNPANQVTINAMSTSADITATVSDNTTTEANQTVTLTLSSVDTTGSNGAGTIDTDHDTHQLTISDNDPDPSKSPVLATPRSVLNDGARVSTITATLRNTSGDLLPGISAKLITLPGTEVTPTDQTSSNFIATSDANGVASFYPQSTNPGRASLAVTVSDVQINTTEVFFIAAINMAEYRASAAAGGLSPGSNAGPTDSWKDLTNARNGALSGFVWNSAQSGWGGNGTVPGATALTGGTGPYRLIFNSNNSTYVGFGSGMNGSAAAQATTSFSMETWLRRTNLVSGAVILGNNDGTRGMSLQENASGAIDLRLGGMVCTSSTILVNNEWYHVIASFNALPKILNLYINGIQQTCANTGTNYFAGSSLPLIAGGFPGPFWNGEIGEIRIYNNAVSTEGAGVNLAATVNSYEVAPATSPSLNVEGITTYVKLSIPMATVPANAIGVKIQRAPDVAGVAGAWTDLVTLNRTNDGSPITHKDVIGQSGGAWWYRAKSFNVKGISPNWSPEAKATMLFDGGNGLAQGSAYLIKTATQLGNMNRALEDDSDADTAYYKLTANIDASGISDKLPIGTPTYPFSGFFDGNSKQITNVTVSSAASNVGLFGYTSGNVTIQNLTGTGGGVILTSVTGTGTATSVGGLVGSYYGPADSTLTLSGITITRNGAITGTSEVGGVLGYAASGTVTMTNVSTSGVGAVTATAANVGGIIGKTGSVSGVTVNLTTVSNDLGAAGDLVKGTNFIGGIIGNQASGTALLKAVSVTGSGKITGTGNHVGGLLGYAYDSTIRADAETPANPSYVATTGLISGNGRVGGLVGRGVAKVSEKTYSSAPVQSSGNDVGGLAGELSWGGSISDSYATGSVTATGTAQYAGGLVGDSWGEIKTSYATGNVSGITYVGGLVGGISSQPISDCYATGTVTASGASAIGGIVGQNSSTVTRVFSTASNGTYEAIVGGGTAATNSFFDKTVCPSCASTKGGTGLTTAEMKDFASYVSAGWDFKTWYVSTHNASAAYPVFRWKNGIAAPSAVYGTSAATLPALTTINGTATNAGTSANPWKIATIQDLKDMAVLIQVLPSAQGGYFKLAPAGGTLDWSTSPTTTFPIMGNLINTGAAFQGTFDGDGKTISNVTITGYGRQDIGFFGNAAGSATIKNLTLELKSIESKDTQNSYGTGGIIGEFSGTALTVTDTNVKLIAAGSGITGMRYVGGIAGILNSSNPSNFTNVAVTLDKDISGESYIGGVIGVINQNATLSNVRVTGSGQITGTSTYVGGLIGWANNATIKADASNNPSYVTTTGKISGAGSVGGMIGYGAWCSISQKSYVSATVESSANGVGGLAGVLGGSITDSYASGTVTATGTAQYAGGLVGQSSTQITTSYSTVNVTGITNVGGLTGSNTSQITDCFATGSVAGTTNVGGAVGSNSSTLSRVFSAGANGTREGIIGTGTAPTYSFYDKDVCSSCTSTKGGTGLDSTLMKDLATYINAGWNFGTWYVSSTDYLNYPKLRWQPGVPAVPASVGALLGGSGSAANPYAITSVTDLKNLAVLVQVLPAARAAGVHYRISPANTTINWSGNFPIIGSLIGGGAVFQGSFDGNGGTINNLSITGYGLDVGMFGMMGGDAAAVGSGTIKNLNATVTALKSAVSNLGTGTGTLIGNFNGTSLNISDVNVTLAAGGTGVTGVNYVGGLVGMLTSTATGAGATSFTNVSVSLGKEISGTGNIGGMIGSANGALTLTKATVIGTGNITGTSTNVGGLVGNATDVTIQKDASNNPSFVTTSGTISGAGSVGGLVGTGKATILERSYATSPIATSANYGGGLVGYLSNGSVTGSYATGNVSASGTAGRIGGLIGYNSNSSITTSYATGTVTGMVPGTDYAGGLVGYNAGTISESYAKGAVTGANNVGGVTGYSVATSLTHVYAANPVTATGASKGCLSGTTTGAPTGALFDNSLCSIAGSTGAGLPNSAMLDQTSYINAGFDFGTVWCIGGSYPTHRWQGACGLPASVTYSGGGDGSAGSPYLLNNEADLRKMAYALQISDAARTAYYKLNQNITLTVGSNFPIIGNSDAARFGGNFDGGGKSISNLTIAGHGPYIGLFGHVGTIPGFPDPVIKNLTLNVSSVVGGTTGGGELDYVGALVGYTSGNLTVQNVTINLNTAPYTVIGKNYVGGAIGRAQPSSSNTLKGVKVAGTGGVQGTTQYVGGLVGYSFSTALQVDDVTPFAPCSVTTSGEIRGAGYVGGLAGYATGNISKSYATSPVYSTAQYAGGLVGQLTGNLSDSYATGNVTGNGATNSIGGAVGSNWGSMTRVYTKGVVSTTGSKGGVKGTGSDPVGSFWSTTDESGSTINSGLTSSFATGIGLTNSELKDIAYFINAGWNFATTWCIADGVSTPTLRAEGGCGMPTDVTTLFDAGTSIPGTAYIANETQLRNMAYALQLSADARSATFKVTQPITLTRGNFPIIAKDVAFAGTFDGQGSDKAISNLKITGYTDNVGFFADATGTIKDLTLHVDFVKGGPNKELSNVGGLVGRTSSTLAISNVTVNLNGDITGKDYVGGIIGYSSGSTPSMPTLTTAQITGTGGIEGSGSYVGGLIGRSIDAKIESNSRVTTSGTVTGAGYVGGFIGYVSNTATVKDSASSAPVTATTSSYAGGLIGDGGGTITNSQVTGAITGKGYVGGLVGRAFTIAISGSSYIPSINNPGVTFAGNYAGGLIGYMSSGSSIYKSHAKATGTTKLVFGASANQYVGGLAGYNGGNIYESYSDGPVTTSSSTVGGLVGSNANTGQIWDSYSRGTVSGSGNVGGAVGNNANATTNPAVAIRNIYASGQVSTIGAKGGLIAAGSASSASFYDKDLNPAGTANGVGVSTSQLKEISTFLGAGWDLVSTWYMDINAGTPTYPVLDSTTPRPTMGQLFPGAAPGGYDYAITSAKELINLGYAMQFAGYNADLKAYQITGPIDMTGKTPPVIGTIAKPFKGVFDGGSNTISNGSIKASGSYSGLFGAVDGTGVPGGAKIRNLTLSGWSVEGGGFNYIGGLVGQVGSDTTISGITMTSTGTMTGSQYVGALIGAIGGSNNTVSTISISGAGNLVSASGGVAGGLAGELSGSATVSGITLASTAAAKIIGSGNYTGGVFGRVTGTGSVTNATSTVEISGTSYTGGLFGSVNSTAFPVSKVKMTAKTSATGSSAGGIAGEFANAAALDRCGSEGIVTGSANSDYIGGVVGILSGSASITYCSATSSTAFAIQGRSTVGGLIGRMTGGIVSDSYSKAPVKVTSNNVGGLIGEITGGAVDRVYATGWVTGTSALGGLAGTGVGSNRITSSNSFWDTTTTGRGSTWDNQGFGAQTSWLTTRDISPADGLIDVFVNPGGWSQAVWDLTTGAGKYPTLKAGYTP